MKRITPLATTLLAATLAGCGSAMTAADYATEYRLPEAEFTRILAADCAQAARIVQENASDAARTDGSTNARSAVGRSKAAKQAQDARSC